MCFVSRSCSVQACRRRRVGDYVSMVSVGHRCCRAGLHAARCARHELALAGQRLCPDAVSPPPWSTCVPRVLSVHEAFAHPVPDSLSDDAAAMLEPLSVGVWACRRRVRPGSGSSSVRDYRIAGTDCFSVRRQPGRRRRRERNRLDLASASGPMASIDVTSTSLADAGVNPDVLLECSGHPRRQWPPSTVAPAGRAVLVGMGADELALPMSIVQAARSSSWVRSGTPTPGRRPSSWRRPAGLMLDLLVTRHYSLPTSAPP